PDRIVGRKGRPRAQRAHVGLQPAAGDPLFQPGEVIRRRVRPDERLVLRAGEEARGVVARRFDLLQRVIEAPCGPRAIEAPNGPLDTSGTEGEREGQAKSGCGSTSDRVLKEFAAVHALILDTRLTTFQQPQSSNSDMVDTFWREVRF